MLTCGKSSYGITTGATFLLALDLDFKTWLRVCKVDETFEKRSTVPVFIRVSIHEHPRMAINMSRNIPWIEAFTE